jgi:two-component system LytT family response regulator
MINCIAIDDEPLALQQIELYIEKTPFLNLLGLFENALEALTFIDENAVDLMFVDIQMPNLNGMEMVKSMKTHPEIIFTTAYSGYALEGFRVDALDYILKPLDYTTFLKSANKAKAHFDLIKKPEDKIDTHNNHLYIKSDYKIVRVNIDNIIYIEGMGGYLKFHLENSQPIMTLLSMKKIEEKLSSIKFMRVHRSYLVNLNKINIIERGQVVFDKVRITISEQYKDKFQAYLDNHFMT